MTGVLSEDAVFMFHWTEVPVVKIPSSIFLPSKKPSVPYSPFEILRLPVLSSFFVSVLGSGYGEVLFGG